MVHLSPSRRWIRRVLLLLLGIALLVGALWAWLYVSVPADAALAGPPPAPRASLPRASAPRFPKQTPSHCGAYSLAEAVRLLTGDVVDGESLVPLVCHEVSWSEDLTGAMPWKVVAEAQRRGLRATERTARAVLPDQALVLLRKELSAERAVVLLVESERRTQHFVLLVGHEPGAFFLYDPNFAAREDDPKATQDANGEAPGNRTLPDEALLALWSRGGLLGLYTWWYAPIGR